MEGKAGSSAKKKIYDKRCPKSLNHLRIELKPRVFGGR